MQGSALVFDLDDTLIVEQESADAAFLATCELATLLCGVDASDLYKAVRETCRSRWHNSPARTFCLRVGISSWEGMWAEFQGEDDNLRILRDWSRTYRDGSWHDALLACGVDDVSIAAELGNVFVSERRNRHVVYEDALPALEHFSCSHRLALLTNGSPDLQRRKIEASGLVMLFDEIIISGEIGIGKPDTRVFDLVLSRMGVTADVAFMIGDSLRSDIQPANAIGMKTVWVNRTRELQYDSIAPDIEVSNLLELRERF